MSLPREGSRDTSEGLVISTCPDVCLTPVGAAMVPIPYSIVAKQSDDAGTATSVLMTGLRTHTMGSIITTCTGDEPGTGKGIKSGTVTGICEPKTFSAKVRAEGKNVIRHNDEWRMNNGNAPGRLIFIKNTETFPTSMNDANPEQLKPGQQYAKGGAVGIPMGVRLPDPRGVLRWSPPRRSAGQLGVGPIVQDAAPSYIATMQQLVNSLTLSNVRVSTRRERDEICKYMCQCLADRGEHKTYTDCVAAKLRTKHYDPNSGQHPKGGPSRPAGIESDGPRPEVSYKPDGNGGYAPVLSKNVEGMPSNAPVVSGAPRPDISWWQGGKLWKIFELKFAGDRPTKAQEDGRYEDIADSQGLGPEDVKTINVEKDCECSAGGGAAKNK